jgi:hypothetical protein
MCILVYVGNRLLEGRSGVQFSSATRYLSFVETLQSSSESQPSLLQNGHDFLGWR